ncbi:DUF6455 family protein [Roseobacteraceae bacterium NS-SX3]
MSAGSTTAGARPHPLGDPLVHLQLLGRMGRATGADLADAFAAGLIGNAEWAAMVTACRGCASVEGCRAWLEEHDSAATPPEGCCNSRKLQELRRALRHGN